MCNIQGQSADVDEFLFLKLEPQNSKLFGSFFH